MITAKPLKRKDLGRSAPVESSSGPAQYATSISSVSAHIDTTPAKPKRVFRLEGTDLTKAIILVVEKLGPINHAYVQYVLLEFAKRKGLGYGGVECSGNLCHLVNRGILNRFKYDGVYYYFKRVE